MSMHISMHIPVSMSKRMSVHIRVCTEMSMHVSIRVSIRVSIQADRELEPVVYKSSGTSPTKGEYSRVDRSFDDESADPTAEGFA